MSYWALFFMICGALFRRMLGTEVYIGKFKIHRFFKLVLLVIFLSLMYNVKGHFPVDTITWLCFAWVIGWTIRYNSHSHGDYWVLYDKSPDEGRCKWVDKALQKIFGKGKYYNFAGNFIGLTLGYLVPALMASILMPSHWFWIAGFTTPIGYAACELALGKESNTEYAEYLNGATMFLLFFLNA